MLNGGYKKWKEHINQVRENIKMLVVSVLVWQQLMAEKSLQEEEAKVEKFYQLKIGLATRQIV